MSKRPKETNLKLKKRLKLIEGQIRGLIKMVDDERECIDILNQILSASSALRSVWEILAATHLQKCITSLDSEEDRNNSIEEIIKKIKELK